MSVKVRFVNLFPVFLDLWALRQVEWRAYVITWPRLWNWWKVRAKGAWCAIMWFLMLFLLWGRDYSIYDDIWRGWRGRIEALLDGAEALALEYSENNGGMMIMASRELWCIEWRFAYGEHSVDFAHWNVRSIMTKWVSYVVWGTGWDLDKVMGKKKVLEG